MRTKTSSCHRLARRTRKYSFTSCSLTIFSKSSCRKQGHCCHPTLCRFRMHHNRSRAFGESLASTSWWLSKNLSNITQHECRRPGSHDLYTFPIVDDSPSAACRRAKRRLDEPFAFSRTIRTPNMASLNLESENGECIVDDAEGLMQYTYKGIRMAAKNSVRQKTSVIKG